MAFLQKRVESREVAEDILQSAFLRGLEHGGLRDEESAVAWFYRVLRNAVIDHYRRRGSSQRALENWKKELGTEATLPTETRKAICECLMDLVGALKTEYRDALQFVDLDEGSLNDLADRAGITPNNAAVRVHRAREALRKQIQAACGTCAEHGCVDCHCKEGTTSRHCGSPLSG